MSRKQRQLLSAVAASTLVIGLQSFAAAEQASQQQQSVERWKIIKDEQPKTQKTVAPLGGSTGPTVPPKPTQGNTHK